MGILNVTPDSFWDGGKYATPERALARARAIEDEGADILDVGAESTRPGSRPISAAEESERLLPVLEKIIPALSIPVCVDTTKAVIAAAALRLGARMINDTSALGDPRMAGVIAGAKASAILMHRRGLPRTMQEDPVYVHCVEEIARYLQRRAQRGIDAGIARNHILVDPGIGFGKKLEHNVNILQAIKSFRGLGFPVVLGISRKSFLGSLLGEIPTDQRLAASLAAAVFAFSQGANILRVHDVRETAHARKVLEALLPLKFNDSPTLSC